MMNNKIGNASSGLADRLHTIHSLLTEGKSVEAKKLLLGLAPLIKNGIDSVREGEYYYLQAVLDFNSKPHSEVLKIAQIAYSKVSSTAENLIIGRIQALIGKLHVALGELKSGEEFIRDSISSFRRIGEEAELISSYNKLAQIYFVRANFKQAAEYLEKSLQLMELTQEALPLQMVKARGNLARIWMLLGKWQEAEPVLVNCIDICQELKASVSKAKNLLSLGLVKYLQENYSAARQLYQQAHKIIKSENLIRERSIYHEYMGDLFQAIGDLKMARQHYNYSLEIGHRIAPQSAIISQTERRLAELEFKACNYALASEHAQKALDVAEHVGELVEVAAAKKVIAALMAIDGENNKSCQLFEEAILILETTGEVRELAISLFLAGKSLICFKSSHRKSERFLRQALKLSKELDLMRLQIKSYYQFAHLDTERGKYDDALISLKKCDKLAHTLKDDRYIEESRILRLKIEEQVVESGLSKENQFILFSSYLSANEYDNLRSGDLQDNLKILKKRVNADRAFVLLLDKSKGISDELASLEFKQSSVTKIVNALSNGRGGSIPLDKPMFISSLGNEHSRIFDYLVDSKQQIKSLITIPLHLADDTLGLLYLDIISDDNKMFTKLDLFFTIAFSDIIAFKSSEEQKRNLSRDNERLKNQLKQQLAFPNIITASKKVIEILERVQQIKDSPISILIEGETGTGKDFLAKAIHYNSNRKNNKFVSVNCAALPETLLESELFGYRRGAFTGAVGEKKGLFEEADGGTFFLDEIGDMPLSIQVKLLRVIEEKEFIRLGETSPRKVDVRIISATNHILKQNMDNGSFRQDLYYRLSTFAFKIPPLRDRREDVPLLINHFLEKNESGVKIDPEAFNCLAEYDWPGNIRELENEIQKLSLLTGESKMITKNIVSSRIVKGWDNSSLSSYDSNGSFSLYDHIAQIEKKFIVKALHKKKWVKKYAAEYLSIPESTLRLKIKQYRISKN